MSKNGCIDQETSQDVTVQEFVVTFEFLRGFKPIQVQFEIDIKCFVSLRGQSPRRQAIYKKSGYIQGQARETDSRQFEFDSIMCF